MEEESRLQVAVTDEQGARKFVQDALSQVKGLVATSGKLTTRSTESEKLLEAAATEIAFVKEDASCLGSEKADSDKVIAESCEKSKHCLPCFKAAFVGSD